MRVGQRARLVGETDTGQPQARGNQFGVGGESIRFGKQGTEAVVTCSLDDASDEYSTGIEARLINTNAQEVFGQSAAGIAVQVASTKGFGHLTVIAE